MAQIWLGHAQRKQPARLSRRARRVAREVDRARPGFLAGCTQRTTAGATDCDSAVASSDGTGRCGRCSIGAQTGRYGFPCSVKLAADEALRRLRQRVDVVEGREAADRAHLCESIPCGGLDPPVADAIPDRSAAAEP